MDVRTLAPALMALSDLFAAAHAEISDGPALPPSLQVQATREGSFAIELILGAPDAWGAFRDLFDGGNHDVQATVNAASLVTVVVGSLAWIVKRHRAGPETSVEQVEPGELRVTWPDGTTIDTTPDAAALVENMDFRRAARQVVAPVAGEGIDEVEVLRYKGRRQSVKIERQDLRAFDILESNDRLVSDSTRAVTLRLLNVAFNEGHKWRVHDGLQSFYVSVEDLRFLQRIGTNEESFARDDRLRCEMRERQYETPTGLLRIERQIVKVFSHERAGQQGSLPLG